MPDNKRPEGLSLLDLPEFITVDELAHLTRRSAQAIYQERLRGQRPGSLGIRIGSRVLFRAEDIKAWLEEIQAEQARDLDW